jgi:hypothetical protein
MSQSNKIRTTKMIALAGLATLLGAGCAASNSEPRYAVGAHCSSLKDGQTAKDLYEKGAFYSAAPIREKVFHARALQPMETRGATLRIKSEPDMNSSHLHRVLACHAAHDQAAHPNDPLHPSSGSVASLEVQETKFGFEVAIRADNRKTGEEIWKRAEAVTNSTSVEVEQVASTNARQGF